MAKNKAKGSMRGCPAESFTKDYPMVERFNGRSGLDDWGIEGADKEYNSNISSLRKNKGDLRF